MQRRGYHSRRRGVAGIVGSAIFFSMIFIVGTSYFLSINAANLSYDKAFVSSTRGMHAGNLESLVVSTSLSTSNNHVLFYANNTGGLNVNVTAVFLLDSSGNVLVCDGRGLPTGTCSNTTPSLPITINTGKGISWIDTGYAYPNSGIDTLKVVTERGSIFSQTYPQTLLPQVQQAVTTIGAGFVSFNYGTFRAYNTTSNCNPSNYATCTLANYPTGVPGYTLCTKTTCNNFYIFAGDVTNVDPQKRTITLDSHSQLMDFLPPSQGGGTQRSYVWLLGSVNSQGQTGAFSTITLLPGQSVAVYFSTVPQGTTQWPAASTLQAIFIYLHGTLAGTPYGQAILFGTTVYK